MPVRSSGSSCTLADTVVLPGSNTYSLLLGEIAGGAQYYYDGVVLELDVAVVHRNVSASF